MGLRTKLDNENVLPVGPSTLVGGVSPFKDEPSNGVVNGGARGSDGKVRQRVGMWSEH